MRGCLLPLAATASRPLSLPVARVVRRSLCRCTKMGKSACSCDVQVCINEKSEGESLTEISESLMMLGFPSALCSAS